MKVAAKGTTLPKTDAWHLPWGADSVPHGILDILRGCNISCAACYNRRTVHQRSLAEIERDLDTLCRHRRLQSVSIVGGEVLLHPGIREVIRLIVRRGLRAELFTNGLLLDDDAAGRLREAGLDLLFLHIERGQRRPDLPVAATASQLAALRTGKAELAARHGIEVALSITGHGDRLDDIQEAVAFVLHSPHAHYLLVTLFRDHANYRDVRGNLREGLHGRWNDPAAPRADTLTNLDMQQLLRERFGLRPFAYLGSNVSDADPRWLSFLVATALGPGDRVLRHPLKASGFEKIFVELSRRANGCYPMYRPQRPGQLAGQLLFNALTGGDLAGNLGFLSRAGRPGVRLRAKRLLFQCPAELGPDGRLIHCRNCPDAVARGAELVPVCIADKVEGPGRYDGG